MKKDWVYKGLIGFIALGIIGAVGVMVTDNYISTLCQRHCFNDIKAIPYNKVGLVLGTAPYIGTRENLFFNARMEAAAKLYHGKKVRFLLVSGDNGRKNYDEVSAMKAALMKLGVPAADIFMDHAGFRTLDSIVRAKKVFMEQNVTVISQPFHNARALYVAKHYGMQHTVGFNARDVPKEYHYYTYVREKLARVKALIDVKLLNIQPRFLGPQIIIGGKG